MCARNAWLVLRFLSSLQLEGFICDLWLVVTVIFQRSRVQRVRVGRTAVDLGVATFSSVWRDAWLNDER